MNGFLIRLRLILKLWFTSLYSIFVMLLIPIAAYVIYSPVPIQLKTYRVLFMKRRRRFGSCSSCNGACRLILIRNFMAN